MGRFLIFLISVTLAVCTSNAKPTLEQAKKAGDSPLYERIRNEFIKMDKVGHAGENIQLEDKELLVDEIIRKFKSNEISIGYKNQSAFPAGIHFFQGKPIIEKSKVFDIIKKIPKGSALHIHNTASVSAEFIIKNLTYEFDINYCTSKKGQILFVFEDNKQCVDSPVNIKQEREGLNGTDVDEFDQWLEAQISMFTDKPCSDYSSLESAWTKFQSLFNVCRDLFNYVPFYKAYHYRMLEEHYDDGVFYMEMRAAFGDLYDEKGEKYNSVKATIEVAQDFASTHPDFIGLKGILATYRAGSKQKLAAEVDRFIELQKEYPDFLIGLDFVGQEDLLSLLEVRSAVKNSISKETHLFLHAGETNWWGAEADMNLFDAILMNTKRIGHGYAILKHPAVLDIIKKKRIGIEVSVISNQVLHLVSDFRNHPAAIYLASDMPVVITNDDPTFWGAKGLSYDWYLAFMAFSPADAGLKFLKQLGYNAINYSYLTKTEQKQFEVVFERRWDQFLDEVLDNYINYFFENDVEEISKPNPEFLSFY